MNVRGEFESAEGAAKRQINIERLAFKCLVALIVIMIIGLFVS